MPLAARTDAKPIVVVAMHARSGIVGLNVVTGALDADARTAGLDVRFARDTTQMIAALREVHEAGARAVAAWSFYSPDFHATCTDLTSVKQATRELDVLHVAGGVHASAEPLATLRAGFDLVAIGEGEHTMIALVLAARRGRDVRTLAGTAYLDESGSFVSHGPGERPELDAFPPFNVRHRKWNAVEITRGCVYACSFCQTPYMFKARFRHRSLANIRAHIDAMTAHGSTFMRFLTPTSLSYGSDDTSVNLDAVDALLATTREGVGAGKVFFGTFPSEVRPEHVSERALTILARWVDNRTLVIGGQSGSNRMLEAMRRGHDVDAVIRAVELCVAAGFRPDVDFLFGMPGETTEDRKASIALAERLVRMGARIHTHAFMPLPGTPLRDEVPTVIEPETATAMIRLEGTGSAYGNWRKQVVTAERLVRARREIG